MADLESVISSALADATGDDGAADTTDDTTADTSVDTSTDVVTDAADTSTDTTVEAGAEATAKAQADAKAVADAEDAFAKEHGLLDKLGKRENRIPYSRVKTIIDNANKKLAESLFGEKFAADKPIPEQIKAHVTRFAEVEQENQGLKAQMSEVDQVEQIMLQRPEQFLTMLPHINPKFAELLAGRGGAAEVKDTPAPAELPKPDMDVTLPDGSKAKTYSVDGIVALVQAVAAQTRDKTLKDVDAKVKPFTDREQAARTDAQIIDRLKARVDHARRNWRGFKDWETDIQAELGKDREQAARTRTNPTLDLQDAYIRVRDRKHDEELAKLKADRETMRKDLVKEINGQPRSTAATAGARKAAGADDGKPKTMEDVIKASMEGAGLRG